MLISYFEKQDVFCIVKGWFNIVKYLRPTSLGGGCEWARDQDLFPQISPHLNYYNNWGENI